MVQYIHGKKYKPFSQNENRLGNFIQIDGPMRKFVIEDCTFENLNIYGSPLIQMRSLGYFTLVKT